MKIKLGADPEFFLKNGTAPVSAHDLVPGTKDKPHPMKSGAIQADGTAIEFNIEPAETPDQFAEHIGSALREIRTMVPRELEFNFSPSVIYPKDYFDKLPEYSKELGCNPDYNAYTADVNPPPGTGHKIPEGMRTGAGHLHIGWTSGKDPKDPSHMFDCCEVVKRLDRYFRPYEKIWDHDTRRSSLYGARGAFRPKPYGVEYRVLSNAWLKHPRLWPWLFQSVQCVVDNIEAGITYANLPTGYPEVRRGLSYQLEIAEYEAKQNFENAPLFPVDFARP